MYFTLLMDKHNLKKLKKYIRDDRPFKLKSFVKKHGLKLTDVELSKGRSLLHYCCLHGSGVVMRFFLHEGICPVEPDHNGNLPLHIALQRALDSDTQQAKEVYTEFVLPLLEIAPQALEEKNYEQISCRELLEEVVNRNTARETEEERGEMSRQEWEERLTEEMSREQEDAWGRYHTENDYWEEYTHESYDQWSERLHADYKLKHNYKQQGAQYRHSQKTDKRGDEKASRKRSSVIDEEELRKTRERLKRKYEENQKRDMANHKTRRKCLYEKNFSSLLKTKDTQLTFDDIPWPSKGSLSDIIDVMFCDIHDRSSSEFKKYLRDQQVKWHPDKFTQKFGKRLVQVDKDRVMDRVKEISQALNKLSETLPS